MGAFIKTLMDKAKANIIYPRTVATAVLRSDGVTTVETALAEMFNKIYPVGAIFTSVVSTSPATLFGGTWVALGGRFLIGVDGTYSAGLTGGEATHILTDAEMPIHTHIQNSHNHNQNAHIHQVPRTQAGYAGTTRYNPTDLNSTTTYPTEPTTATNIATTAVNQNAGGDSAHNNLPPYLAVYMWKRTA